MDDLGFQDSEFLFSLAIPGNQLSAVFKKAATKKAQRVTWVCQKETE
jgi:hypothetical protein